MYGVDERILEQFFYHGTENISELIEGIIFFSTGEMHKLYANLREQYDTPNEIQLAQIKDIAYKYGLQYYRFIHLNKYPSKLIDYKTENESERVKQIMDIKVEETINKKSLIGYKVGYYYSSDEENRFLSTYVKNYEIRKFWAIEVAEQLKQLSILEEKDPVEYYNYWIKARLENAKSRLENRDNDEIKLVQEVKTKFDERRELSKKDKSNANEIV